MQSHFFEHQMITLDIDLAIILAYVSKTYRRGAELKAGSQWQKAITGCRVGVNYWGPIFGNVRLLLESEIWLVSHKGYPKLYCYIIIPTLSFCFQKRNLDVQDTVHDSTWDRLLVQCLVL